MHPRRDQPAWAGAEWEGGLGTDDDLEQSWDAALPQRPEARRPGPEPGQATSYLREHYAALMRYKNRRGYGWPEMARLFNGLGMRTAKQNREFDGNTISGLFHQERYRRNPKSRKRRPTTGAALLAQRQEMPAQVEAPSPETAAATEAGTPHPTPPAVGADQGGGWMEELARRKREKEEAAAASVPRVQHKSGMR